MEAEGICDRDARFLLVRQAGAKPFLLIIGNPDRVLLVYNAMTYKRNSLVAWVLLVAAIAALTHRLSAVQHERDIARNQLQQAVFERDIARRQRNAYQYLDESRTLFQSSMR